MYPRLVIDIGKLRSNLDAIARLTKKANCSLGIVTKGLCADPKMVDMVINHEDVDIVADSRIKNLETFVDKAHEKGKKTLLLRLPQHSEVDDAVRVADISFISELSTMELLNQAAAKQDKVHGLVLMIDMGDLREGIFFKEEDKIFDTVEKILAMKNISLEGIGVNLTCYGAIIPKYDILAKIADFADRIERKYDIKLNIVSGGNSSSLYLIDKGEIPEGINNLRIGEAFLLGTDTAYGGLIEGTCDDAITLEAQIIELQEKPSLPIGEVGKDAFGNVPEYEDRGIIKRAILAVGQQDIKLDSMEPVMEGIDILGASSDHTLLDVSNAAEDLKVGDLVTFKLGYGGMLSASTSAYVDRRYK